MTSAIIKGNDSGTGSVTLAAPNTNSDVVMELPSPGADCPLIESYAHATGYVTKMADGTMIITVVGKTFSDNTTDEPVAFPESFASQPAITVGRQYGGSATTEGHLNRFEIYADANNYYYSCDVTVTGFMICDLIAIGRWY